MTKQEWKLEYRKWRSFWRSNMLQTVDSKTISCKDVKEAHKLSVKVLYQAINELAHTSIRYAITNKPSSYSVREVKDGKWAIRCNMDLSPLQLENHRLKARGECVDVMYENKTRLAQYKATKLRRTKWKKSRIL